MKKISLFGLSETSGGSPSITVDGESCIYVKAGPDPSANFLAAQAAYDKAITLTPYGNPISDNNRVTVYLEPGKYTDGQSIFMISKAFIDVICNTPYGAIFNGIYFGDDLTFGTYSNGKEYAYIKGLLSNTAISITGKYIFLDYCYGSSNSFQYVSGTIKNCIVEIGNPTAGGMGKIIDCTAYLASKSGYMCESPYAMVDNYHIKYDASYTSIPLKAPVIYEKKDLLIGASSWIFDAETGIYECILDYTFLSDSNFNSLYNIYMKTIAETFFRATLELTPVSSSIAAVKAAEIEPYIEWFWDSDSSSHKFKAFSKNAPTDITFISKLTIV